MAGALLGIVLAVAPALFIPLPLDASDPPQEVARDASWWLRKRVGGERAVVYSSPNATTWMAYFGGLPGVGSLYWENLEGLRAATAIYTAPTADSLRALLAGSGVTHLVLYPWDGGLELLRLARAAAGTGGTDPAGVLPGLVQALRGPGMASLPAWLSPLPYPPPALAALGHPAVIMLEVVPDQPREIALVRLAQYYQAVGAPAQTEAALRAATEARPTVAGWAMLAQLEASRGGGPAFGAATEALRAALAGGLPVEPADRLNAAVALALARDGAGAAHQLDAALAASDERTLRRLPPDALGTLVRLARQLGLERTHPEVLGTAERLLRP